MPKNAMTSAPLKTKPGDTGGAAAWRRRPPSGAAASAAAHTAALCLACAVLLVSVLLLPTAAAVDANNSLTTADNSTNTTACINGTRILNNGTSVPCLDSTSNNSTNNDTAAVPACNASTPSGLQPAIQGAPVLRVDLVYATVRTLALDAGRSNCPPGNCRW